MTETPETPETEVSEGRERESLSPRTIQNPPNNLPQSRQASGRDESGRFPKGVSGNPGGRPKSNVELVEAARELTPMALQVWEKAMTDFLEGHGDAAQALKAASDAMVRGWGKPPERVAVHTTTSNYDSTALVEYFKRLLERHESARPALVSSEPGDRSIDATVRRLAGDG